MLSTQIEIRPATVRHPLMSGDILTLIHNHLPVALQIPEEDLEQFAADILPTEWQLEVSPHPWGSRTLTIVAPKQGFHHTAHHGTYQPTPKRDRSRLSQIDWNNAAPSPNPGLLAYYVSENVTAISVPVMTGPALRHDTRRRLFFEINVAPHWMEPATYQSEHSVTLHEERALVDEMRRNAVGR